MTKKELEFRNSDGLRKRLAEILDDPTMKMALEIISVAPHEFPLPQNGTHYDVVMGREFSRIIGINSAIKKLRALCEKAPEPKDLQKLAERTQWLDNLTQEQQDTYQRFIEGGSNPR